MILAISQKTNRVRGNILIPFFVVLFVMVFVGVVILLLSKNTWKSSVSQLPDLLVTELWAAMGWINFQYSKETFFVYNFYCFNVIEEKRKNFFNFLIFLNEWSWFIPQLPNLAFSPWYINIRYIRYDLLVIYVD